jgi:hypothetical protein
MGFASDAARKPRMFSFLGPRVEDWLVFEEFIAARLHQERGWTCCETDNAAYPVDGSAVGGHDTPCETRTPHSESTSRRTDEKGNTEGGSEVKTESLLKSLEEEKNKLLDEKRRMYKELKQLIIQEQRSQVSSTKTT